MSVPGTLALCAPRWLAARNAMRAHPWRAVVLLGATAGFWIACFVVCVRVLGYFHTLGDFGPLLTQRLLVLLFLSFLGVLLVSNTVTALTTFYLSGDVVPLLAAPLPWRRLHHARFLETLIASSWMVLLVGLPALIAYGVVYGAGPTFYLAALAVLALFLVIPAAIGVLVTTALVLVFPARGARDALLIASGLLLAGAVVAIRLLEPERLAHPSGLVGLAAFLAGAGSAGSPWFPSTWAAEVLLPLLGARDGTPLFFLGMLASTAVMLFLVSATVVELGFLRAWSAAQTGRVRAGSAERPLGRVLAVLVRPLPRLFGLVLAKDATVFLRDPSQWSQLLLLCALVGIYLFNFSALPLEGDTPLAIAMREMATVLNLGLGAFVTTAVAVRFVYPMPSMEGHAWWILRTAPVGLAKLWWSKFWLGWLPLVGFAAALVATTNALLGVPGVVTVAFLLTLPSMLAAIVSLGLAFGAVHAKLDTRNAAQIATGFGAIVYMLSCLGVIAGVVALEAWPVGRLLRAVRHGGTPAPADLAIMTAGLVLATVAALAVFEGARRRGLRALARLPI
ncbi:MAG: hypothetical protein KIT14_05900 [bacterium]|nr:hypothetical protein [bacterium]